ncbi:MAG TPA: myxococcus cysteine-rich repeat containing protein [Vulgatibacter sp.]
MSLRSFGLVSTAILLLTFGCGEKESPPGTDGAGGATGSTGGAGGEAGGMGGSGGSAGSAGTGGTGGSGPVCGDGVVEGDEECDDGNLVDADACSATCRWHGTCADPIDFWSLATKSFDPDMPEVDAALFSGHDLLGDTSCRGGGKKLVYRIVPEADGVVLVAFDAFFVPQESRPRLTVRRDCAAPEETQVQGCITSGSGARSFPVTAGVPLFLLVDEGGAGSFRYSLRAGYLPYRQVGDVCELFGNGGPSRKPCAPGLSCDDVNSPDVCVVNEAPVLSSVEFFRAGPDGSDLVFHAVGSDPNGNTTQVWADIYDESGEPLPVSTIPDLPHYRVRLEGLGVRTAQFDEWVRDLSFFVRGAAHARADSAELFLTDSGLLASAPVRASIGEQAVARLGEPCDRERLRDVCESGAICLEEGGVCEDLAPLRAAACATAPAIELDVPLPFEEPLPRPGEGRVTLPHLWEAPSWCLASPYKRQDFYKIDRLVTQLARLTLDRERTNVHLRLEDAFARDLVMMIYPECGTSDPPLVCADDPEEVGFVPEIKLPHLPAGDYLVVVRPTSPRGPTESWTLIATADP